MKIPRGIEELMTLRLFVIVGLVAALAYSPVFLTKFGIQNDYNMRPPDGHTSLHPETYLVLSIGRPLEAILLNVQFQFVRTVSDLRVARLFSFLVSFLLVWILLRLLVTKWLIDPVLAVSMALCILVSPPMQYVIVWWSGFATGLISVLVTIWSYLLVDKAFSNHTGAEPICRRRAYYLVASWLVFFASLMLYEARAMFIFVLILMDVIFSDLHSWPTVRRRIVWQVSLYASVMVVYYIFIQHVVPAYMTYVEMYISRPVWWAPSGLHLTRDLGTKASYFLELSRFAWAGSWHLVSETVAPITVLCLVLISVFVTLRHSVRHSQPTDQREGSIAKRQWNKWAVEKIGVVACLLILCNSSRLLSVHSYLGYRLVFPYTVSVLAILFWILNYWFDELKGKRLSYVIRLLAVGIALSWTFLAHLNVANVAKNLNLEFNYIRGALAEADVSSLETVAVVQLPEYDYLLDRKLKFEFATMATNFCFIGKIVTHALLDLGSDPSSIETIEIPPGASISPYLKENLLVIDMNRARIAENSGRRLVTWKRRNPWAEYPETICRKSGWDNSPWASQKSY